VIIVMEDHGMMEICAQNPPPCSSSNGDPYTAGLANTYSIGTQYAGVSHFSQADYIALLGGGIYGCVSYPCQPSSHVNLVDRLETAGLSWKGYMENQAAVSGCDFNYNQPYTPEHNPFVFFKDITSNAARCSKIVLANPTGCSATDCALINDLNSASAPSFMWLTPNNCNNMHGYAGGCASSIPTGDNYLSSLVPNILGSQTFKTKRSALFLVFDEGNGYCPLDGSSKDCVYAVWAGHEVKPNFVTSKSYDHYSFTRTIEENWKLASLGSKDVSATPMTEFFSSTSPPSNLLAGFTYSPSSPQVNRQVNFTGSATGGTAPYTFTWAFGDGSTGTGNTATHAYQSTGNFNVVLTVKDNGSPKQTANSQHSVTVTSPPPPPPLSSLTTSFSYNPPSPTAGQQITFSSSASGGTAPYVFNWSFGDGSTSTGSTATHTYATAGSYAIILKASDSGSPKQTASSQQTITVTSPPPPPPPPPLTASFSYSPSSPSVGQQVTFTSSATGGSAPYSFSWTFGDGSTGAGPSATKTYSSGGTFTIILTVRDGGSPQQSATSQQSVTVTTPPPPPPPPMPLTAGFTYTPSNPVSLVLVHFTGSASGGTQPYTYSWDFGDGFTATGVSVSHSYLLPGTYTVTLTVSDANGQTATLSKTITVSVPLVGP
jgi:PKD repeat protein